MAYLQNPAIGGVMFIPDKAICFDGPSEAAWACKWQHSLIFDCSLRGRERLLPPDTGCHYQTEESEMDRPFLFTLSMADFINLGPCLWEWCVFLTTPSKLVIERDIHRRQALPPDWCLDCAEWCVMKCYKCKHTHSQRRWHQLRCPPDSMTH